MTLATLKEAMTIRGDIILGKMPRNMTRRWLAPILWAGFDIFFFALRHRLAARDARVVIHCPIPSTSTRLRTPVPIPP